MRAGGEAPAVCPSAPAAEGALLIGVVGPDGRVAQLGTALAVDRAFLHEAAWSGPPERRFRFAAACQSERCRHWTGNDCGLIGRLQRHAAAEPAALDTLALRACGIRADCRWWRQAGAAACAICPLVITDGVEA